MSPLEGRVLTVEILRRTVTYTQDVLGTNDALPLQGDYIFVNDKQVLLYKEFERRLRGSDGLKSNTVSDAVLLGQVGGYDTSIDGISGDFILSDVIPPHSVGVEYVNIVSNDENILSVDWEDYFNQKIIIRVVAHISNIQSVSAEVNPIENMLILTSTAEDSESGRIQDGIGKEVSSLFVAEWFRALPKYRLLYTLDAIGHASRGRLKGRALESYQCLHLIMHGNRRGSLLFDQDIEDNVRQKAPDYISHEEFIELLGVSTFTLVYLSCCYGAGLDYNLAYALVSKNKSAVVIGFKYGLGEESGDRFARIFYESYFEGKTEEAGLYGVVKVFQRALRNYVPDEGKAKYVPMLYTNKELII